MKLTVKIAFWFRNLAKFRNFGTDLVPKFLGLKMTKIDTLRQAYEDLLRAEWEPGIRYNLSHKFTRQAYELMPYLLECVAVLNNKMDPLRNNQENHIRALNVLENLK